MLKKLENFFLKKYIKNFSSLKNINKNLIYNFNLDKTKIKELVHRQKAISGSKLYHIDKIYWLVEDCKKYGSLPFAGMARCGFVAIETLNSLVDENIYLWMRRIDFYKT